MPCIHGEWAILGDDVRDASLRLLYYYIFIEKPWQALNIAMVGLYYVQMGKGIVMIFLCDIFSGACGMLKSLHNHRQSQQPTGSNGGLMGADAEKILSWSLNQLQLSLYQQAGGTRSKYIYWRRKGSTEQWENRVAMIRHPGRRLGERGALRV